MLLPINHLRRIVPEAWRPRFHFITRRLPAHWFYLTRDRRLWWLTGVADEMRDRINLVRYDLQEGCFLETYWIDRAGSDGIRYTGPAAFLVVHGCEILKFDCYAYPMGHYHIEAPYPYGIRKGLQGNIWLPEKTVEVQIERAAFEVQRNSQHFVQSHPRRKVRRTRFDEQRLATACAEMKAKMLADVRQFSARELHGDEPVSRSPDQQPGKQARA